MACRLVIFCIEFWMFEVNLICMYRDWINLYVLVPFGTLASWRNKVACHICWCEMFGMAWNLAIFCIEFWIFWMVEGIEVIGCLRLEVNLNCIPSDWIIGMRFTFRSSFWKAAWFLISFKAILERRNFVFSSVIWHRNSITWLIHCSNNCWSFPCKL